METGDEARADPNDYVIRPMVLSEYENILLKWVDDFPWILGFHDFSYFTSASPGCHLTGVLNGVPIASVLVFPEGPSYCHIALYVVDPRYRQRGLGYGRRLFEAALERQAPNVCFGLDASSDNVAMYEKRGFVVFDSMSVLKLTLTVTEATLTSQATEPESWRLAPVSSADFLDKMIEYDREVTSLHRGTLIRSWLVKDGDVMATSSWSDRYAVCVLRGDSLVGYGVCSPARTAKDEKGPFIMGPICCDDAEMARSVLKHLLQRLSVGAKCVLYRSNQTCAPIWEGWEEGGRKLMRMHLCRGPAAPPKFDLARIFAGYTPDIA